LPPRITILEFEMPSSSRSQRFEVPHEQAEITTELRNPRNDLT
jgi:hypothetical protein